MVQVGGFVLSFFVLCGDRALLCSHGWPETHYADRLGWSRTHGDQPVFASQVLAAYSWISGQYVGSAETLLLMLLMMLPVLDSALRATAEPFACSASITSVGPTVPPPWPLPAHFLFSPSQADVSGPCHLPSGLPGLVPVLPVFIFTVHTEFSDPWNLELCQTESCRAESLLELPEHEEPTEHRSLASHREGQTIELQLFQNRVVALNHSSNLH